jgi:hypothetical protein
VRTVPRLLASRVCRCSLLGVVVFAWGCAGKVDSGSRTQLDGGGGGSAAGSGAGGSSGAGGAGGGAAGAGGGPSDHGLGAPCVINSECTTPLVCAFGKCHLACESSRDCPDGQQCRASDRPFHTCQLVTEVSCHFDSDCPTGQRCGPDGKCRDQCASDRDCVTGQLCVAGLCAEPQDLDAGGLPDGH